MPRPPQKCHGQMKVTRIIDGEETEITVALTGNYYGGAPAGNYDPAEAPEVTNIRAMHGNDEIGLTDPELTQAELVLLESEE